MRGHPDFGPRGPETGAGEALVPECQIAPVMHSLALGVAPDVYGREPLDAIASLGIKTLCAIGRTERLDQVPLDGLVDQVVVEETEREWLVWRPDPEFPRPWDYGRYVMTRAVGRMAYPGGQWEFAHLRWDAGRLDGSPSRQFFPMILRFGWAGEVQGSVR